MVLTIQAGTYSGAIEMENYPYFTSNDKIPSDMAGRSIHIVCEITDRGISQSDKLQKNYFKPMRMMK